VIVVLDSGVWISALQFDRTPLLALRRALVEHRIAYCHGIQVEVLRVLTEKMGWGRPHARLSLLTYLDGAVRVAVSGAIHGACRDPTDDMVFECAWRAGASLIVSGDKDLLVVGKFRDIRVVTARDYVDATWE
jgi:putative PIN family toxin of toxin-antitoxin system